MNKDWLAKPDTARKLWIAFIAILSLVVVVEFAIKRHASFGIDGIFGFNAWYGFAACVALVAVAKAVGFILKRRDTYYDD